MQLEITKPFICALMWRGNQIKNIGERTSNPSHVPSQKNLHAKKRFRIKGLCLPSESSGNSRVMSSPAECAIPQKSAKIYFEVGLTAEEEEEKP